MIIDTRCRINVIETVTQQHTKSKQMKSRDLT